MSPLLPGQQSADPARLAPAPAGAPGFPSRSPSLDVLPGFRNPPPGYGEVPFWWWTGDRLDKKRLLWQIEELHRKGVTGMQVNYAHEDTPGWPTYAADPEVFSEEWWEIWAWVVGECRKRGMGIGLSGYTLDWPGKDNLFSRLIYADPELNGMELTVLAKVDAAPGRPVRLAVSADTIAVRAWKREGGALLPRGTDLLPNARDGAVAWEPTAGTWQVWAIGARRKPRTLNPMHPEAGKRVIERFFQPCADRAPGGTAEGLNYFFQDELQFGVGSRIWCADFAEQFRQSKGYDILDRLPALFEDIGPITPKVRLDYADVKVRLCEERYFRPVFDWHWSRGMIYGCDPGSRGRNPAEFGDYMRCVRWYTAPGHDTPGGNADLIKDKVSSSIAHLYQRPRVWLEGYHSLGWGATPERLMTATRENFLYGATLLNLHGLYYSTHGSFWEWAPPCYHFRMPYWQHMGEFLRYFERLSYLLSQGVHRCDVAVLYPVAPFDADMDGKQAADTAFGVGKHLVASGYDFDYLDFESLGRAELRDGRLQVSGESYRVLILPAMRAIRWSTLQKALAFRDAGGIVVALGALPEASDRAGREDPVLAAAIESLFGQADETGRFASRPGPAGSGLGAAFLAATSFPPRTYDGGFAGRWVWSGEKTSDVWFKAVWRHPTQQTLPVMLRCDNRGDLYVNGKRIHGGANYATGWTGQVALRDGDVLTVDAHDDDQGNRTAGFFFAIVQEGNTVFSAADFRYTIKRPADLAAWRTSRDLTGLAEPTPENVHPLHRGEAASQFSGLVETLLEHVPRDVETDKPCTALHRRIGARDVYMVMGVPRNTECTFRVQGRPELWDPWTGKTRPLPVVARSAKGTRVRLPLEAYEAQIVVFEPEQVPAVVSTTDLEELTALELRDGVPILTGHATTPGLRTATVRLGNRSVKLMGEAPAPLPPLPVDGPWEFEMVPTMDNRWGDFRLPATLPMIGPEARLFRYAPETRPNPGSERPGEDDQPWEQVTHGFGPRFWQLGPLPDDADLVAVDAVLAALAVVDPAVPVTVGGKAYAWTAYAFSWRWGREGDPGHQGYHGLKKNVTDDFLCLGKPKSGLNETLYIATPGGNRTYLWTAVATSAPTQAWVRTGDLTPAAVFLNGARVTDPAVPVALRAGGNPLLLRYDDPGRGHVVLERVNAPEPTVRTSLSMRWGDLPGCLAFDIRPDVAAPAGWYRFTSPPGFRGMTATVRGRAQAWSDGAPMRRTAARVLPDGTREFVFAAAEPARTPVSVALRVEQDRGEYGGAAFPEPILLDCGAGETTLGDWAKNDALACYSGSAWYRRDVTLDAEQAKGPVTLDLGQVAATAEVRVNGQPAGIRVAPPWRLELTGLVRPGVNRVEVLVCNTLANHYRTIPTRYRGSPVSGLLGPVALHFPRPTILVAE
jgi:hypothetical protein